LAFERRIDNDDRYFLLHRSVDRTAQGILVERRQHNAAPTFGDKLFHDRDLLRPVVLLQRTFPSHIYAKLLGRLARACFDRFPENVSGSLRNDCDRQFLAGLLCVARRDDLPKEASAKHEVKEWLSCAHNRYWGNGEFDLVSCVTGLLVTRRLLLCLAELELFLQERIDLFWATYRANSYIRDGT